MRVDLTFKELRGFHKHPLSIHAQHEGEVHIISPLLFYRLQGLPYHSGCSANLECVARPTIFATIVKHTVILSDGDAPIRRFFPREDVSSGTRGGTSGGVGTGDGSWVQYPRVIALCKVQIVKQGFSRNEKHNQERPSTKKCGDINMSCKVALPNAVALAPGAIILQILNSRFLSQTYELLGRISEP
ncbi:hypothetical protein C7212DRAFT_348301 [Tuber magnatum]|uniref:Uncharacterized protein n=1 Tax=Tuber magnatum TaxID=42249 RepID=A0A317SDZ1_9PEZI|nr:hypothetical protein C7212DRAFT_348301 [Tuber magnatum]